MTYSHGRTKLNNTMRKNRDNSNRLQTTNKYYERKKLEFGQNPPIIQRVIKPACQLKIDDASHLGPKSSNKRLKSHLRHNHAITKPGLTMSF